MRYWKVFIVILLVLSAPTVFGAFCLNTGMVILRDGLLTLPDRVSSDHSPYGLLLDSPEKSQIVQSLRYAGALDEGSSTIQWALGRALLYTGDVKAAVSILTPLRVQVAHNPLLYRDTIVTLSRAGFSESVKTLFLDYAPPETSRLISDTVALAYLDLYGSESGMLEQVYELRPGDLYANYYLWKRAREAGDVEAAALYSETLTYFPLESINPTDERLLKYATEIMPSLFEQKLWDRERLLNVITFLVWQYNHVSSVEFLLQRLVVLYPTEPECFFYLGEVYQRRGDWELAENAYRQVLVVDPNYAQAYLRLGMVAEERCGTHIGACEGLRLAVDWYEQYHELAPNDVLGLQKLVELSEFLSRAEALTWEEKLITHTDDRYIVAEMLGVPTETVMLGDNLVRNGILEEWSEGIPEGWQLGVYLGGTKQEGLYVAGEDLLNVGGKAARIITLWGGNTSDGNTTYAEYIGKGFLAKPIKYLISLQYASQRFDGTNLVYLGEYAQSDGLRIVHSGLPNTDAQWVNIHILTDGPSGSTIVIPLIRNWGIGQLWFSHLMIMPVTCGENLCQ